MLLTTSPISRNLRTSVRILGMDFEDLMVVGIIAILTLIVSGFVLPRNLMILGLPGNWFCFLAVLLTSFPGLMAFKYGKPRGYLTDFLTWYLRPRERCALEPDSVLTGCYLAELSDEHGVSARNNRGRRRA